MGFEVQPTGLRPGNPRSGITIAVVIGAALIGLGFAARSLPASQPGRPSLASGGAAVAGSGALASPAPASPGLSSAAAEPPGSPRPLPTTLECRDVPRDVCTTAASAALSILDDSLPAVSGATVWRSMLCSVPPDCPPQFLTQDSVPLGSVIVSFVDAGSEAWINVVQRQGPTDGSAMAPARAWIVRWH